MTSQPPPEAKSLAVFSDGISDLAYLPSKPTHVAATSWDGTVRIHDTSAIGSASTSGSNGSSTGVLTQAMESGPLLSLATPSSMTAVVTGGIDGSVRMFDYASSTMTLVGRHEKTGESSASGNACSCLSSLPAEQFSNLVASASWNRQFCLWDLRASNGKTPVGSLELPGKAFSMSVDPSNPQRLVVATSGRRNCIVDLRGGKPEPAIVLDRESSLKFQTRSVSFFPDGRGFALGSVEGRVGVEFLDELGVASTMKRYAFKCHRVNDTVYPVNCIAFHPKFKSTFATGGCDGSVVLWDGQNKKKLTTLPSFPTSISAIAFNHDGSEMAIASSYTFEDGDREHPQDELFIRKILDSECVPKPK